MCRHQRMADQENAPYRRLVIHYLSGTGNALVAARWFSDCARRLGMATETTPIDRFETRPPVHPDHKALTGFFFPTHGFSLPWYMLRFMWAFPKGKGDVFCLNTFGGTKIGRLHLPGLSGVALILPAILFMIKGFRVRGLVSLNMPSNWISLHPGLAPQTVASITAHCLKKAETFAASLLSGKPRFRGILSLPLDLAVTPLALGYTLVGRFWLAKMYVATFECDGCGICVSHCPTDALIMKKKRPFWTFRCESCMRCLNLCPKRAIQVSHLFTAVTAYLLYGLAFPFAVLLVSRFVPSVTVITSIIPLIGLVRAWAILSVMFILYRLMQEFARHRTFNYLFAGLSITHLSSWRRYLAPGITAKDLKPASSRKTRRNRSPKSKS
jgi:Pyruvate/2-oxoacid:ferredoxin oxidoreductase delta subunit